MGLQDYHTIYKLCYSDLQDHLQVAAVRHITEEGRALYERHARTHPHGLPGVALKVLSSPVARGDCMKHEDSITARI